MIGKNNLSNHQRKHRKAIGTIVHITVTAALPFVQMTATEEKGDTEKMRKKMKKRTNGVNLNFTQFTQATMGK